jgi:internalin A
VAAHSDKGHCPAAFRILDLYREFSTVRLVMARDTAYGIAETKIEQARRTGATVLDLSITWNAIDYFPKLTAVPESLGQLTQLEILDLDNNELTELPESLGQLTKLQMLNLDNNELMELPEWVGQLTQLQTLKLFRNQLTALPESLGQLTQLQTLNLSYNQLTALPESLRQLTQLQTLNLHQNKLTALPESLAQLTKLQMLYLDENELTDLPEWLGQLMQLQSLNLSGNQLTALPESLGQLTQLQTLNLSGNQLTALPEWLGQLTQLQTLNLSSNQLTAVPKSLGQLTQLKTLNVSNNQLTALPESLCTLKRLKTLLLASNVFRSLPTNFGDLRELRSLTLGNTDVESLPDSFSNLASLQFLFLSDTPLRELPNWIGRLKCLEVLDISNGEGFVGEWEKDHYWSWWASRRKGSASLSALPRSLIELPSLRELYLHGNEDLDIPNEILGPSWHAVNDSRKTISSVTAPSILDYYFSTRGKQGRALRELKLIVVGRGGAGKTSLVRRLGGQKLNLKESETHGIKINHLSLDCKDGPVTARVWDFGGQHVLHAMHEFFLTARSLYLLVLGEREDMAERDAAYWLQLIRSYAGNAPVVIALNKSQGRRREMDRASLEENYGPILAWVPTECADGFQASIEDLRAALTAAADQMPEVRHLFPSKWWEIKEWLENMSEPYLDFAKYQEACIQRGEQVPQQQEKLGAWLNDLGIAINYANDKRLHDTTVLRPDWLANGIYAILRANDSRHDKHYAPDAMLTQQRLGPIYKAAEKLQMLEAKDYPRKMWPFLLRLMNLFQLAFPIDDKGEKLLVPTLLPLEPPEGCDEPTDADRTRLRYEFAVVPGPLLPKLLVRTFSLIEDDRRWRRGAILRYGDARARVWATQDERWVHITAIGPLAERDELLTMIRETLRDLLREYRDLRAVEQWEDEGDWVPRRRLEREGKLPVEEEREEVQ